MNDKDRIEEVYEYDRLNILEEQQLNDLVELASIICDTPIALITMLDRDKQWFKAKKGIEADGTLRKDSFCQHTFNKPNEVLVVADTYKDERFVNNPLVLNDPNIRFYAGAPLVTPKGNVLGTICVIDNKPKTITSHQEKCLKLLSNTIMNYFNSKKIMKAHEDEIKRKVVQLQRITDQSPGIIFHAIKKENEKVSIEFISDGITRLHPLLTKQSVMDNIDSLQKFIHPEDLDIVLTKTIESHLKFEILRIEYRVILDDGSVRWWFAKSIPEKIDDTSVAWYGTIQDITARKEYEQAMEQISFDISHVLRRPVSNLLGLVDRLESENEISVEDMNEYVYYIKMVSNELEDFTKQLNETYYSKSLKIKESNVYN